MNLPNKITTFRMICVFIVDFLLLMPWNSFATIPVLFGSVDVIQFIAFVIFLLASFSDFLDGYLARKLNLVTTYGKFMDPIADKLLVDSVFIILGVQGFVPAVVVVIMICRDLLIDALRQLSASKGYVLAANMWGKVKTVTQMVALSFALLHDWPFSYFDSFLHLPYGITTLLCYISAVVSLISCVLYFSKNLNIFKDSKEGN
jgi:CDP-diacylglycerol--glycerol-3-phosphate 3-phosphatidyltransferase